jgi:hypothetical protein
LVLARGTKLDADALVAATTVVMLEIGIEYRPQVTLTRDKNPVCALAASPRRSSAR